MIAEGASVTATRLADLSVSMKQVAA
jgi:hypothetical protein